MELRVLLFPFSLAFSSPSTLLTPVVFSFFEQGNTSSRTHNISVHEKI